ncbi:hypothetical protein [Spirosoma sp.]|uniref:hypothetical protein n=1 Tax=Spirosoma sp. TaxID=1899569 RepID=UPI0026137BF1|nr:hypothetical protein [Spirosoma sp.]MCX6216492.1 hypothetical protein [Spirosoma sp.]
MTEPEYIAYFEGLASKHKAIRHVPGDESSQGFFLVQDDNMAELEQAVRNKLQLPALLLDQYFDELDTTQDNNRLRIEGGFSIICKIEQGDTASIRAARHQARLIARSVLGRLRKELRPGGGLSAQNVVMLPVNAGEPTPILGGNATGWGYAITWQMPTSMAVSTDDWLDL